MAAITLVAGTCAACTGGGDKDYANDPASLIAQHDGRSAVAAYSAALDAWQAKCTESRVTDAGYVDATYRDEQKHGVAESSRLVVMRHLTKSVPSGEAPTDCDSATAAYLMLIENDGHLPFHCDHAWRMAHGHVGFGGRLCAVVRKELRLGHHN